MNKIAKICCGSCLELDNYKNGFYCKNGHNSGDNYINVSDLLCSGKDYKPCDPVNNYEDDLLKALIDSLLYMEETERDFISKNGIGSYNEKKIKEYHSKIALYKKITGNNWPRKKIKNIGG